MAEDKDDTVQQAGAVAENRHIPHEQIGVELGDTEDSG